MSFHSKRALKCPLGSSGPRARYRCRATVRSAGSVAELDDPVFIMGSGSRKVNVRNRRTDCADSSATSLETYMRLPVEQYSLLDPDMIVSLPEQNKFKMIVPEMRFFNLAVEARAYVKVDVADDVVYVSLEHCLMQGSSFLESLQLDRRFFVDFKSKIWFEAVDPSAAILAESSLKVWCEPTGPFKLFPRVVLKTTCDAVLGAVVAGLLPLFMSRLRKDYHRWLDDPAFREERAVKTRALQTGDKASLV